MGELLDWLVAHEESFRKARLPSLYSDFLRQKATNPDGYKANVTAWSNGLCTAARAGAIPSSPARFSLAIDAHLLQSLRSSEYGTPEALSGVIDECMARGQMMPYDAFISRAASIYDRRWALPSLPSPATAASWLLRQVPVIGTLLGPEKVDGRYVLVENVEAASRLLTQYLNKPRDRLEQLLPLQIFREEVSSELGYSEQVTESDLKILLRHLERDTKAVVYNDQLVKLQPASPTAADRTITSQDADLVGLKTLHAKLVAQEAALAQHVQDLQSEAKTQLAQSNKPAALRALRRKKTHEAMLDKRAASLAQVEGVLARIQEASDNVAMVQALEGGAAVLKQLNKETGGVEKVDKIVDSLQEEMEQAEQISGALESAGPTVDEGAVDEELEALEQEAKQNQENESAGQVQTELDKIPKVPDSVGGETTQSATAADADKTLEEDIAALQKLSVEEPRHGSETSSKQRELATAT